MAITKIAGDLLESNLIRSTDLAFNTNVLVVDVDNERIGVGTATPGNFKLDVVGDTRITGDLTVTGTTTTVDSQNLTIEDNMIVLNSSGSIGHNSGVMIQRGAAGDNAVMYWDESIDKFKFGTTSADGSTTADFASTLAKLQIGEPVANSDASTKKYVDDNIATVQSSGGVTGTNVTLGLPTDSSVSDGAVVLNTAGSVTDAIDDLNETQENIRSSYYVKSVTYTRTPAAGSLGMTVTLAITAVGGGATRYTIDWGDGTTETVSATNPTHDYDENSGTPYTITVKAYNHNAVTDSAGSFANSGDSMTNLQVTVYTSTPVPAFGIFETATDSTALTGNDLWVVEGQTRYMENATTNTSGASVAYTMNWGDGTSADTIANDSAAGGVNSVGGGARLSHTWGGGTLSGTGSDTLTLSLTTHSTCNPALLPITATASLKVYDNAPSAPNHLGSKTIAMNAVVGTSPKLCSGFTENVSGSPTYSAGDSVNRITTVDPVRTASQSTFCYNADSGTLTAYVNGSADGAISLSSSDNSGTATSCTIESESDYNLLNATGAAVSFANSIYHPNLYKGFKAIVSKATSGISTGVNSFQLQHTLGNTNVLEFVKDNVTATPTSSIGTVSQNAAGNLKYVSGIPYYNDGSPSLSVAGSTITNFTGQCYQDTSSPVEIDPGTNQESTSGHVISNLDFTYATIGDGSTTVPAVNLGVGSAYTLATLTVPLLSTQRRSIQQIKMRAKNCNGSGSYSESSTKIQMYSNTLLSLDNESAQGSQAGVIAVADALGATYDDDAVRISGFGALNSNNPDISDSSNANYYTDSAWSGAVTVAGTNEAISRFGTIKHFTTDLSSGYLPVGPDLNTGRSGAQYYTFAFRRATVSQFSITMTGTVSGMWIKLPGAGTDTTSSATNGWLDCSTQYAGSGKPGANTGAGGNGSAGVAKTSGDRVIDGTSYSSEQFTFTLGTESMSNSRGNNCLVRILLNSGDSITALSVGVAE
jgi:hypothetical protein